VGLKAIAPNQPAGFDEIDARCAMELILLVLILIAAMSTVDRDHRLQSRKITVAACGLKHRG
jgi:hypothetical protein